MEPSIAISSFLDAMPVLRFFWHKIMERHVEIVVKKPYSKAKPNTLPAMISQLPIYRVYLGADDPHIYMWADIEFINHKPDRKEFILNASLHLKKRFLLFWHKTLAEVPLKVHSAGDTGPLLENLELKPMAAPITVTVDARGPIKEQGKSLPKRMVLCLELRMIGPVRRIRRNVERVLNDPKQSSHGSEDSQTE